MKKPMLALAAAALAVAAQAYPDKPITIVVPFAAGGPTDKVARDFAEALRKPRGGATVVIRRSANSRGRDYRRAVGLEETPQEMSVGGKIYQNAAADDIVPAEHVELMLTIDGVRDHAAVSLDPPAGVPISAQRNRCGRQPRVGPKGHCGGLQTGRRAKPVGRGRQERCQKQGVPKAMTAVQ